MIAGQKWLGEQALALCERRGHAVMAVCAPAVDDRLARRAAERGIPLQIARRIERGHVPDGADLILCAHAHAYITAGARAQARLGALGYHPSLLPRHRGRDAVRWTIHMREPIAGGTAYWLSDGADTGPIAAQDWCWVRAHDTAEALWRRELAPMGLRLLGQVLAELEAGRVPARPQDETLASWEPAFAAGRLDAV